MPAAMRHSVASVRHDYVKREIGVLAWQEALKHLAPEERAIIEKGDSQGLCPTCVAGRLMRAVIGSHFGGSRMSAESFLRDGGREQADKMLDGLFSVFSRFVSPKQALTRAPNIIAAVYTGATPTSRINEDGKSGALIITGLGDYEYVAPWLSGWMERAIERFGGVAPKVRETSWANGLVSSDELVFEASWE